MTSIPKKGGFFLICYAQFAHNAFKCNVLENYLDL